VQGIADAPVILLRNAGVAIEGNRILENISAEVLRGQRVAIVGKSGAGKSTLLGALVADPQATEGSIVVLGHQTQGLTPRSLRQLRRKTSHISQGFDLVPDLSALENVLIGDFSRYWFPRLWSWSYRRDSRERAAQLLQRFGLEAKSRQRVGTLSGGERQRVAIARALMSDPEILLADEPISALDSLSAGQVMTSLEEISQDGVTVIAALHQWDVALKWATHILILSQGRVVAQGGAQDFEIGTVQHLIESHD
jgi:phosphonate transport system ATP-binding protein